MFKHYFCTSIKEHDDIFKLLIFDIRLILAKLKSNKLTYLHLLPNNILYQLNMGIYVYPRVRASKKL